MRSQNKYGELGRHAARLIKRKAAEIVKLEGFASSDLEDVEQDLALEVVRRKPDFDPKRASYNTFVTRVVDHAMTNIIDKRWALKRNPRRVECSLNELVPDGEGGLVERAETLDHETYGRRNASRSEEELLDLRLDLEATLQKLSPKLRSVCELLGEGKSLPEISEATGIPMSSVYEARDQIRAHFERAGLAEYVGKSSGSSEGPSST